MEIDIHQLNMPWIDSPFFNTLLEEADYDEEIKEMIRYYAENGYIIIDPEIPEEMLDEAVDALDGEYKMEGRINETRRVLNGWRNHEVIQKIAGAPKVYDILKKLYQREPVPFQTLNFNIGTEQKTHSDSIHFHCIPHGFMCGVWVALEDVKLDNGPLHIYPKSHKLPFYDMSDLGLSGSSSKTEYELYGYYEDFIGKMAAASGLERKLVEMKKGQALIWAANLLHGGSPIERQGSTRYSQVTHYYFEDCIYYTPLHSDVAIGKMHVRNMHNVVTGEKIKHKYLGQVTNINNSVFDKLKKKMRRKGL
ncbi:MAG: phytanoyl-CoA dioxygenase family protein [Bacteroidetes bacterium]|nr:phytanoyl-CoA dioxygenase family protein [Bacteroidota bacterium]